MFATKPAPETIVRSRRLQTLEGAKDEKHAIREVHSVAARLPALHGRLHYACGGGGQNLLTMALFITDVHSLGLDVAQGLYLTTGFYWDRTDESRAWSKRFFAKMNIMPTREHAETYSPLLVGTASGAQQRRG
jgi:hypothetical protein